GERLAQRGVGRDRRQGPDAGGGDRSVAVLLHGVQQVLDVHVAGQAAVRGPHREAGVALDGGGLGLGGGDALGKGGDLVQADHQVRDAAGLEAQRAQQERLVVVLDRKSVV